MRRCRGYWCGVLLLALLGSARGTDTLALPSSWPRDTALIEQLGPAVDPNFHAASGAEVTGASNVVSLKEYKRNDLTPITFPDANASVLYGLGQWTYLEGRHWLLGAGSGRQLHYAGNGDAAQLWRDLHSTDPPAREIQPEATGADFRFDWLGAGLRAPFALQRLHGDGTLFVRYLNVDRFFFANANGNIDGDSYSGMVKRLQSYGFGPTVYGHGWTLDLQVQAQAGDRWSASACVEGLTGAITWHGLNVSDDYVISPHIYQDPDGFTHDFWGISGEGWRADYTVRIIPTLHAEIIRRGHPLLFAQVISDGYTPAAPALGIGWPQRHGWMPYLRFDVRHATQEVGILSRYGTLSLTSDSWRYFSPRVLNATFSLQPINF